MSNDPYDVDDEVVRLGFIVEQDRGSLPFHLVHGEPLVACAAWALGEAGLRLVDTGTPWQEVREAGATVVLHDPLCPMTPADFIAGCVEQAEAGDTVVVGVRPVTDTVKEVAGGVVGATVDRDELRAVCSPIVLPADVVATLPGPPESDFATLVTSLSTRHPVAFADAPPQARRVGSDEDLRLLEQLTAPPRR